MKIQTLYKVANINVCAMTGRFEAFQQMWACCFPGKLPWSCAEGDIIKYAQIISTS
jgi:hypothetical protein